MRLMRLAYLPLALPLACLIASAQMPAVPTPAPEDAEATAKREATLQQALDETLQGVNSLRLPENRAIAFAMLGDMYWRFDEKRARELFRNVTAELSAYNGDMEKESVDPNAPLGIDMTLTSADPRYQSIPLIAKHDADLATQIMLQTRRAAVSQAIVTAAQVQAEQGTGITYGFGVGPNAVAATRASQELALEQQIALYAADQDPDAAVRALKESLTKGVSYNVLPLLQKLAKLDEKKANEAGGDVVQKLLDLDMSKNADQLRIGIIFLQYSINVRPPKDPKDKQFNFTDAQQRDIANKLVTSLLAMPPSMASNNWYSQVIPVVDKLLPDRTPVLRQRQAEIRKSMPTDIRASQQRQDLLNPSMTAEQILALLPKISDDNKNAAYAALMNKVRAITDDIQAKRIIDQIPDEKVRESIEQQFENAKADRAIQAGKLDDARKLIAQMTDRHQQINRYVTLALAYNKTGKDTDVETAKSVMRDAKALTVSFPDNGDDLNDLMELVRGYAVIDSEAAFKTVEPAIDLFNQYADASAVMSKFTRDRNFRNGEVLFRPFGYPTSPLFRYLSQVQLLGKADLDRADQMVDRLSRADAKMIMRLYLLQGGMPPLARPPARQ